MPGGFQVDQIPENVSGVLKVFRRTALLEHGSRLPGILVDSTRVFDKNSKMDIKNTTQEQ